MTDNDILNALNEMLLDEEIRAKYKEELQCIKKMIETRINPPKEIMVTTGGPI